MRIEILILVTLLAATAALSKKPSVNKIKSMIHQRQQGKPEIRGGEEAPLHGFPYHVALQGTKKETWYNGALITDRWVITTAWVANELPKDGVAILGAQVPSNEEVTQQIIVINDKVIHESFDGSFADNVALLHLKKAVKLNRFISTLMLAPFNSPDFDGARLVFTGFANTSDLDKTQSKSLHFIVLTGISNSVCQTMLSSLNDGTLCVETTGGMGGCSFDEGAPLVDEKSGLLVGLLAGHGACEAPFRPDLFTRVSEFTGWVMENMY